MTTKRIPGIVRPTTTTFATVPWEVVFTHPKHGQMHIGATDLKQAAQICKRYGVKGQVLR